MRIFIILSHQKVTVFPDIKPGNDGILRAAQSNTFLTNSTLEQHHGVSGLYCEFAITTKIEKTDRGKDTDILPWIVIGEKFLRSTLLEKNFWETNTGQRLVVMVMKRGV